MCYYDVIIAKPSFTKPPLCELPRHRIGSGGAHSLQESVSPDALMI